MHKVASEIELERILALSEYNLDYPTLCSHFDDLTLLASKFAGTAVSMVNLLDSYHQWTIGQHGIAVEMTPREDSICDYTIQEKDYFEVRDLSADERFQNLDYVAGEGGFRYYYGVPITTSGGHNLGALCVLDYQEKKTSPAQAELLQILAREVVNRLNTFKQVESLHKRIEQLADSRKMLAHDIRGPLSGIIGLAELGLEEAALEPSAQATYLKLIADAGRAAINLAEDILHKGLEDSKGVAGNKAICTLNSLKQRILDLFTPRVLKKQLTLKVDLSESTADLPFSRGALLQIIGNLIANAIKFTPAGGAVQVGLNFQNQPWRLLRITIADNGTGMTTVQQESIVNGMIVSTAGTDGETGYGLGLSLVRQLIEQQKGSLRVITAPGNGCRFEIELPV